MASGRAVGDDEMDTWLRHQAIPIECATSGQGAKDLAPLRHWLHGVKIVGMGEVTHGTKEFFQVKLRILRQLVTEMGFKVLAIEASYSAARLVNDYILKGEGNRSAVLTGLRSVMWDVEEFAEALDWLRAYNHSVADLDKVRFYGLDIWNTQVGRAQVLAQCP